MRSRGNNTGMGQGDGVESLVNESNRVKKKNR